MASTKYQTARGDVLREELLGLLSADEWRTAADLVPQAQRCHTTVARHLALLAKAGLARRGRRDGTRVPYRLTPKGQHALSVVQEMHESEAQTTAAEAVASASADVGAA